MKSLTLTISLLMLAQTAANAQDKAKARAGREYPPQMQGCRVETYKTVGDTKLNLYLFSPTYRATVARSTPSSRAICRWDQPRTCNAKID